MASCRACTGPIDAEARYCSQCGAATADDVEVLGVAEPVTQTGHVSRSSPPTWLAIAAGAIVLLIAVGWLVGRGPDDPQAAAPSRSDPDGEQAAVDGREPRLGAPADEVEQQSSTTGSDDEPTATEDAAGAEAGGGPVLDGEVGWSLWYSSSGRLTKLDLDTGEVTEFEVRGEPIHADGGWLVLRTSSFSALSSVPVADPDGAEPVTLPESESIGFPIVRGEERGTAWVLGGSFDDPRLQLLRLSDGTVLGEFEGTPIFFWLAGGAPLLTSTQDGNVFEYQGDSFRRVAEGGLIAAGDRHALISRCASPTDCRLQWLDRPSYEPIDRPLPDGTQFFGGWLSPGGRVLMLREWGPSVLFDVERGQEVELSIELFEFTAFAVSPDERYVATSQGPVRVHDLDTGEVFNLEIGFTESVVFTENS